MLRQLFQKHSSKFQHLRRIYHQIHSSESITMKKLISLTSIKQTTIDRYLKELMDLNLIEIKYFDDSTGGRPPALYQINPTYNYIIGIDISRTHTKIVIVDLDFNMVGQHKITMTKKHTPTYTMDVLTKQIEKMMVRLHLSMEQILGIGIGAVGPLDRENGVILNPDLFLAPGWKDVSIVQVLHEAFPKQFILLENGANTAALAEYYKTEKKYRNILYCISGNGLRCGVLTNGQIVQNKTGVASSFGHMIIQANEKTDANRTLSSYISLDSITKEVIQRMKCKETSILFEFADGDLNSLTIDHLIVALKQEDPLVQEIVSTSAYYYGLGLANMVNILHPEQVILNGVLIYQSPLYYQKAIETAKKYIYPFDNTDVHFSTGILKSDAVAVGAAVHILEAHFQLI